MDFVFAIPTRCLVAMLIGGGLGGAATTLGIPFLLGWFGFSAAGIGAGTLAAKWQATMGGVVAGGGLFSLLQSIAAAGFGLWTTVSVTGAAGSLAYAFCTSVDCGLGYQTGDACKSE